MRKRLGKPQRSDEEEIEKQRRARLKLKQKNIVMPIMTKHLNDQQRICE